MNANFNKFKKKVWTDILIKCLIAALAAGFVAVNAVLLPCKLCGINLFWVYYILIAIGGFAVGGTVAFLVFRTNDKKIAIRLDSELKLSERVQTSLQCGSGSGDMIELLKSDTNSALEGLSVKKLPFKNIIVVALCCFIAVAGIVAVPVISFTVPAVFAEAEEPDDTEKDPPRQVTDWEYAALDDLIKYVQNSKKMDTTAKNGMLSALDSLRTLLLGGVTQNSLPMFVRNTVNSISNSVKDANEQYPVGADNELHPQAKANSEEETYVVTTLYNIFGLLPNSGNDETEGKPPVDDKPDSEKPGTIGPGVINENETPFFDPVKGKVTCGSVRAEYMEIVQKALEEGTISSEEWEDIMMSYFADLGKVNNDD